MLPALNHRWIKIIAIASAGFAAATVHAQWGNDPILPRQERQSGLPTPQVPVKPLTRTVDFRHLAPHSAENALVPATRAFLATASPGQPGPLANHTSTVPEPTTALLLAPAAVLFCRRGRKPYPG